MEKVVTTEIMRKSDAYTIAHTTPSKELMYRAAYGVYKNVDWSGKIGILCGSGNNAGDGYCLASILADNGIDSDLYLMKDKFSEDGNYYYSQALDKGVKAQIWDLNTNIQQYDILVDCLFGTGFKGEVKGLARDMIEKINMSHCYVVSVDINSGLNGDTGLCDIAVKSDLTVSIGSKKIGHLINEGPNYIKKLVNVDIGIAILEDCYFWLEKDEVQNLMNSHHFETISREQFNEKISADPAGLIECGINYCKDNNTNLLIKGKINIAFCDENVFLFV